MPEEKWFLSFSFLQRGYRPDMNFTSYEPTDSWNMPSFGVLDHHNPFENHQQQDNAHHVISTHFNFENEQLEGLVLTQLPEDDIINRDLADEQSQEDDSDYDNNADESGDDTPFSDEGDDDEDENDKPDLTREHAPPPVRPRAYKSHVSFHSRVIPYLDQLPSMPDVDALTRDLDEIRTTMWDESRATVLSKGMLFADKARLSRAVRMYNIKECREIAVHESSPEVYKVVCRRWFQGCNWMLRVRKLKTNLWIVGKYISTHNCEMNTFNGNHLT
ncbi:uncharacterized protein LOC107832473 isoform X2 [Nicotiana tabacum]|uniref:Uncharacterized protein LOC107832473 isoform X2 n=1 Tax=Nicotiana tabacum TaxID=4097 RepID=A0AC58T183_TOBAC